MEYYLEIDTEFEIKIKPTHIFMRVVPGEPIPGFINIYWKLLVSNTRTDGSVAFVSDIVEGNQIMPSVAMVAFFAGDVDTLNAMLSQMEWGGPLAGFILKISGKVTREEVYNGVQIDLNELNNNGNTQNNQGEGEVTTSSPIPD